MAARGQRRNRKAGSAAPSAAYEAPKQAERVPQAEFEQAPPKWLRLREGEGAGHVRPRVAVGGADRTGMEMLVGSGGDVPFGPPPGLEEVLPAATCLKTGGCVSALLEEGRPAKLVVASSLAGFNTTSQDLDTTDDGGESTISEAEASTASMTPSVTAVVRRPQCPGLVPTGTAAATTVPNATAAAKPSRRQAAPAKEAAPAQDRESQQRKRQQRQSKQLPEQAQAPPPAEENFEVSRYHLKLRTTGQQVLAAIEVGIAAHATTERAVATLERAVATFERPLAEAKAPEPRPRKSEKTVQKAADQAGPEPDHDAVSAAVLQIFASPTPAKKQVEGPRPRGLEAAASQSLEAPSKAATPDHDAVSAAVLQILATPSKVGGAPLLQAVNEVVPPAATSGGKSSTRRSHKKQAPQQMPGCL